jgi:hypothetical protein
MTDNPPDAAGGWAPCHCCGRSYPATGMVRFHHHPEHALCTNCAQWLSDRARPIARRNNPVWQFLDRIRFRLTRRPQPAG